MNNKKNITVGCEIFLKKDNTILLGKRKNCYGEGTWGLPGGHLEYGETLIECAKRELKEETGIEALESKLIAMTDNIDERGHYVHASFLVERFTGEVKCLEPDLCYEWQFFNIDNLPDEIFNPHKKIIKNYRNCVLYAFQK